jgi:hypothetical protein
MTEHKLLMRASKIINNECVNYIATCSLYIRINQLSLKELRSEVHYLV